MTIHPEPKPKACNLDMLPTLPGIALQILNTVRSDDSGLQQIGELIAKDPPLSAAILKMVNSSYFGLRRKVATVPHAVNLLGSRTVKNLALSFCLLKGFEITPNEKFDISQFWKASLIGAVATQELAKDLVPEVTEEAFFVGLLKDIGIIAMLHTMPEQYQLVLHAVHTGGCSYLDAETQILGVTHLELGATLLETWGLPDILSVPIGCHHQPESLSVDDAKLMALTQILNIGSHFIHLILYPNKTLTLGMIEDQARKFGFQDKMNLERVAAEVQRQAKEMFPLFEIEVDSHETYLDIIEQARSELIKLSQDFVVTMTRQKQELDDLREQVTRDSMTGLFNYRRFMELLDQEIYRARRYNMPLSILMADIDHFKKINDICGHLTGDTVLQQLAATFTANVRTSDFIARYGGEEFGFILPETDLKGAKVIAERLRQAVEQMSFEYEAATLKVTVSFGIANINTVPDYTPQEMIRQADRALYQAKSTGRNRCCSASGDGVSVLKAI